MAAIKVDGDFSVAGATGSPKFSSPIPGDGNAYVLIQPFMQNLSDWAPLALNTPHPDYADFVLVSETERQGLGEGIVKWERSYAKPPAAHSEYERIAYNFIGFMGVWGINISTITGRQRRVLPVLSRVLHEYFLVGAGCTYATPAGIPIQEALKYYFGSDPSNPWGWTDYLCDHPPFDNSTNPTRTTYETWITAKTEFVAEDSSLDRWMGNIWLRKTRYVVAK